MFENILKAKMKICKYSRNIQYGRAMVRILAGRVRAKIPMTSPNDICHRSRPNKVRLNLPFLFSAKFKALFSFFRLRFLYHYFFDTRRSWKSGFIVLSELYWFLDSIIGPKSCHIIEII